MDRSKLDEVGRSVVHARSLLRFHGDKAHVALIDWEVAMRGGDPEVVERCWRAYQEEQQREFAAYRVMRDAIDRARKVQSRELERVRQALRVVRVDGVECSVASFLAANEAWDEELGDDECERVMRLEVGERVTFGGGAAAEVVVERVR